MFVLLKAPDEVQNTEGLFTVLNEFWATELADILLPRDQVSLGDPLYRGMCFWFLWLSIVFAILGRFGSVTSSNRYWHQLKLLAISRYYMLKICICFRQIKLNELGVKLFSHSRTRPRTLQICQNYFASVRPWVGFLETFKEVSAVVAALVFFFNYIDIFLQELLDVYTKALLGDSV